MSTKEQLLKEYLQSFKHRKYSPQTISSYNYSLQIFLRFLASQSIHRIQDITPEHLHTYRRHLLDAQRYSNNTIYDLLLRVRSFFNYLEEHHHIFTNPASNLIMPIYRRHLHPVPTEAHIAKLLLQPDTSTKVGIRDRALIEVAYATGARRHELIKMNTTHINRAQHSIRVIGKGSKERILPLGRHAMEWLEIYLKDSRPKFRISPDQQALWVSLHGTRVSAQGIRAILKASSRKANLKPPLNAHSLRRACATHMLRRGAHPVQIQMLLGHATLTTLGQYLKVSIADMQKAYNQSNPAK